MHIRPNNIWCASLISGTLISSVLLAQNALAEHSVRTQARLAQQINLSSVDRVSRETSLLMAQLNATQASEKQLEATLPEEEQLPRIAVEFAKLAEANSLTAQPARCTRGVAVGPLSEQVLQMSLTGDFNAFYAFLLQLEQSPYAVRTCSLKLHPLGDRDGQLQADLVVSVRFRMTPITIALRGEPGQTVSTTTPAQ